MGFERFTRDARAAVVSARDEARTFGHHTVEAEHLLLALARRPEFHALGLDRETLAGALVAEEERGRVPRALAIAEIDVEQVRARI